MTTLNVLIVDDELGMRLGTQKALNRYSMTIEPGGENINFRCDTAGSAEEAVVKIRDRKPDILLLDYKLPGMSGIDLLEHMDIDKEECSIIMITAYASLETAVSAIKKGAFDFIAKPFTPQELNTTVEKAVKNLMLTRQVKKLAKERHEIRFQFISVLGHELKAPINAVQGYLHLMKDGALGTDIKEYKEIIDRCFKRTDGMLKLIADILDLTKIESGKRERILIKNNLVDIAHEAIETASAAALEKNIKISLHAKDKIYFVCDKSEIEIILNNLLSNAVKYNKKNGSVDLFISKKNNYIEITVEDTGIGISEEDIKNLFNEFVRIKNSKTRDISGSGLGLAIVKKIVSMYHGSVSVKSCPDKGSTFTVKLSNNKEF